MIDFIRNKDHVDGFVAKYSVYLRGNVYFE